MDALQSKGRPGSTPNLRIVATISTAEQGARRLGGCTSHWPLWRASPSEIAKSWWLTRRSSCIDGSSATVVFLSA